MKIYRAWSDSDHKIIYTIGFFEDKEDAEKALQVLRSGQSAMEPAFGIEEMEIIPPQQKG